MGVETQRFIRKPLYVDAVRVTMQNFEEIAAWCQGEILTEEVPGTGTTKKFIKVRVHNPLKPRQTKAFIGDWLLYTERGYKVYTNKAFRAAFDQVEGVEPKIETETPTRLGNVSYTPEEKDQRAVQELDAPLSEDEEAAETPHVIEEAEIESVGPVAEDPDPTGTGVQPIHSVEVDEHTTPQGEPHEYIEATPESIADAVNEQQPQPTMSQEPATCAEEVEVIPVEVDEEPTPTPATGLEATPIPQPGIMRDASDRFEQDQPVSEQSPEVAAAGKRVLSLEEQKQMGSDAVREMVRGGDVVLAQDLAESA